MRATGEALRGIADADGLLAAVGELAHRAGERRGGRGRTLHEDGVIELRDELPIADDAYRHELLWIRLGSSEAMLSETIEHLRARPSGGTTVLLHQLVQGQLADIAIAQAEIGAALAVPTGFVEIDKLNRRITDLGRGLLRLLGAAGYLRSRLVNEAGLSEVLLDIYAGEET